MKKEKKKSGMGIGVSLLFIFIGGLFGAVSAFYIDDALYEYGFLLGLAIQFALMALAYFIHIIIHEAGHLVAGLMSGYSFGSFRIGSLMLIKQNGKLVLKKHSVAGTGGQCLMILPELKNGDFPAVFYNLGGVLMNLLVVLLSALLSTVTRSIPIIYVFFVVMALMGIVVALTNGIPLKLGMINNDGANTVEIIKSKEAKRFFYYQFKILENINNGKRIRDIDGSLFPMPSDEGMKYSLSASGAVFLENRLLDEGRFSDAVELIDKLLSTKTALIGLHKLLLTADKISSLLILGERTEEAHLLYTSEEYQSFKKQMKNNISLVRVDFAHALLYDKDENRANEIYAEFQKCAALHPYPSEIEGEEEILERIRAEYSTRKGA